MVKRIDFVVSSANSDLTFSVELSNQAVTVEWLQEQIKKEDSKIVVKTIKYEDDEGDLVTISSDEELLEALTIADVAGQNTLKIFATIQTENAYQSALPQEQQTQDISDAEVKTEDAPSEAAAAEISSLFPRLLAYVGSLDPQSRVIFVDAVQVGIQELREGTHPKQALTEVLNLLPESSAVVELQQLVETISQESWEAAKTHVSQISAEQWNEIESRIPQLFQFLPLISGFLPMLNASVGGSASNPNIGNLLQMLAMNPGAPRGRGFGGFPHAPQGFGGNLPNILSMLGGANGLQNFGIPSDINTEEKQGIELQAVLEDSEVTLICEPGSKIVKTWKILNSGTRDWPSGVRLVAENDIARTVSANDATAITVPTAAPGQVVEVSQLIEIPQEPGSYFALYKLKSLYGHGQAIGSEIPLEIHVLA